MAQVVREKCECAQSSAPTLDTAAPQSGALAPYYSLGAADSQASARSTQVREDLKQHEYNHKFGGSAIRGA
jgi:hypothetical protein